MATGQMIFGPAILARCLCGEPLLRRRAQGRRGSELTGAVVLPCGGGRPGSGCVGRAIAAGGVHRPCLILWRARSLSAAVRLQPPLKRKRLDAMSILGPKCQGIS